MSKFEDGTVENRICFKCVGDVFLEQEIEKKGVLADCSYCGEKEPTISIEDLADRVGRAVQEHYEITSSEPTPFEYAMLKDSDSEYSWDRSGEPIGPLIESMAGVSEEIAEDVRQLLEGRHLTEYYEEGPFDEETHYAEKAVNDVEFSVEWDHFEHSLKTRNRFFGLEPTLEKVFGELVGQRTRDTKPVIVEAGPGLELNKFSRARLAPSASILTNILRTPEVGMGPPPPHLAIGGRMNARGISVFYGATEPEVAIAEVRPPVGSKVVVAQFVLSKKLRLLDVEGLRSLYVVGSEFDPTYAYRLGHAQFLRKLSHRISMPVMPDDEPFDYLVTQAISDYLSAHPTLMLDGIIYPSALSDSDGRNVVLFHKSSRVLTAGLSGNAENEVTLGHHTEDGYEDDYSVFERSKAEGRDLSPDEAEFHITPDPYDHGVDNRMPSLQLDRNSILVHDIKKISVVSDSQGVLWHKQEHKGTRQKP